ncbi:KH domain-containing protein HEN4 isoform X1 [Carica papaya]|uniref:KH domain-containing protein HEN4 isoform X1 n=1 Tax=Carica papaya TaxID=3649 RepID=UPI000B8C9267|nr:KH domain-containing protein HEN4 isoform X1 [Carica papaya]
MGSHFLTPPAKRVIHYTGMLDSDSYTPDGSAKRAKTHVQPLPVPGRHVAFRLLCPVSRVGGVIGKSGSVIKQLQQSTGAKIRVEEAPSECPERVITVVAPSALTLKWHAKASGVNPSGHNRYFFGNEGGDGQGDVEISKAQEALIKVFDRILEVAVESGGSVYVEGGVVSCRLLAEKSHAGSVIGKGGKVVKKIKKESGCKIKVLAEKLPACAELNDEIVELEGDVLAVRKALVAVSRCLQDCQPTDKTRMVGSKPVDTVSLGTLHLPLEIVPQEPYLPQEPLRRPIDAVALDSLHKPVDIISRDPFRRLEVIPQHALRRPVETVAQDALLRHDDLVSQNNLRRPLDVLPQDALRRPLDLPPQDAFRRAVGVLAQDALGRHIERDPQETPPHLRVDLLSHRDAVQHTMVSSSVSYVSGVHSLPLESEQHSTLDGKTMQQEVVFKILCPTDRAGGIIGKGGAIIRALQSETGASVSVGATLAACDERLITVSASENPELRYSPAQKAIVLVFTRSVEAESEKSLDSASSKGASITARLVVPSNQVGCLLGKGGSIISEIRKATGTGIRVIGVDRCPKCVSEKDQVVQISGEFPNVKDAIYHITGRLRDNLFSRMPSSLGTKSSSSVKIETSPYGKLTDSTAPVSLRSSVGLSQNLSRHSTFTPGMDHLGFSHTYDSPPSPRLWGSQTVGRVNSSMGDDVGRGLTATRCGLELGSGKKTAIVTNTTVEIRVPGNLIGSVYGENGRNLDCLRQISGAKVIVHEPHIGTNDRIIVISGTPDETQAAQSLLQAFILT